MYIHIYTKPPISTPLFQDGVNIRCRVHVSPSLLRGQEGQRGESHYPPALFADGVKGRARLSLFFFFLSSTLLKGKEKGATGE